MKSFKEFGIKPTSTTLQGEKIKISKILNREIVVEDFKINDSKFNNGNNDKKCLSIQFKLGENRHVIFTGSKTLMDMISQIPKIHFPFKATVVAENDRYEFV